MAEIRNLICPKCHKFWGTMDFSNYPDLSAKNLRIVAGNRYKPKDGASVCCSLCGYEYSTWDVILAGVATAAAEKLQPGEESTLP